MDSNSNLNFRSILNHRSDSLRRKIIKLIETEMEIIENKISSLNNQTYKEKLNRELNSCLINFSYELNDIDLEQFDLDED